MVGPRVLGSGLVGVVLVADLLFPEGVVLVRVVLVAELLFPCHGPGVETASCYGVSKPEAILTKPVVFGLRADGTNTVFLVVVGTKSGITNTDLLIVANLDAFGSPSVCTITVTSVVVSTNTAVTDTDLLGVVGTGLAKLLVILVANTAGLSSQA